MIERIKEAAVDWWQGWNRYECTTLAAATAYYAALSTVPLMMVLMAGAGAFFNLADEGQDAREKLIELVSIQVSPDFSEALDKLLSSLGENAATNGPLAGVGLLFSASLVFVQIDRGFARIWEVGERARKRGVMRAAGRLALVRVRSLAMIALALASLALLFVTGLLVRGATGVIREYLPEIDTLSLGGSLLIGFALNVITFATIYKLMSKARVGFRLCLHAGLLTAALWEAGSRILAKLSFGENYGAYGHVGSLLVLQVWIYYTAMVLFAGAVLVRVANERQKGGASGPAAE